MLEGFFKFLKELDRRVKVTIAGAGIHNWSQSLIKQYNPLYARALGANPVELGLLNSIGSAARSIVGVPLGWAAEKYSIKKVMVLGLACTFIVATIYALAGNWWILIPAIILGGITTTIFPFTDIILISYTKNEQSGTVMGFSRTIRAILSIFAPTVAAVIVASFGGITDKGIRPLYYVQLVLAIFVFLFITVMLKIPSATLTKNKGESESKGARFIQDFRELFKGEKWLKRWLAIRVIKTFAQNIAVPFIPLWMVDVKGATPYIFGVMGTVSIVISVFMPVLVGRLADKIGRKKAYYVLSPITYLGTVLLVLAPGPEYLIVVGLLQAIGQASSIAYLTMHWEMVPKEKRGTWFSIGSFTFPAAIPATILGGILWQQGFMIEVLLLPILLEVLVVIPILFTVPDTLGKR